jgi:inhibitor of cysteine peptidase
MTRAGTNRSAHAAARLAPALAVVAALAGCESIARSPITETPATVGVAPRADDRSVDLRGYRIATRVGENFEIRLPGNPSTGYRWTLVDPVPTVVVADGVVRGEGGRGDLVGAGAQETWTFRGAAPGTGWLNFEYRRPFDPPSTPPAQRTGYRVEVR